MATQATYTHRPGSPYSIDGRIEALVRVSGINYTAGTPETIEAVGCGMRYITHITGGMSESKTYVVVGSATGVANGGIHWFTSSNGSEATVDTSAEFVTLRVIGY